MPVGPPSVSTGVEYYDISANVADDEVPDEDDRKDETGAKFLADRDRLARVTSELSGSAAPNVPPVTTNRKNSRELPPCIRVIQGDGISYESMQEIYDNMI